MMAKKGSPEYEIWITKYRNKVPEHKPIPVGSKIQIIYKLFGASTVFGNLIFNSYHITIEAPIYDKSGLADYKGVWVMGTCYPVKIREGEFKLI